MVCDGPPPPPPFPPVPFPDDEGLQPDDDDDPEVTTEQLAELEHAQITRSGMEFVCRSLREHLNGTGKAALLGACSRNPFTGRIDTDAAKDFLNFHIVDLFRRSQLSSMEDVLASDPYLFKPIPLMYRTWIYHDTAESNLGNSSVDENGGLVQTLRTFLVDAPCHGGRWSPLMVLVPLMMFAGFTEDMVVFYTAILFAVLGRVLSQMFNNTKYYRFLRLATVLPRWGYYCFVLVRLAVMAGDSSGIAILGYFGALACALVDFMFGDMQALWTFRLHCYYEVLHSLPNRIFVCRRVGAGWLEEKFGPRGLIGEDVTGVAAWGKEFHLIAEIQGMLVELRPMELEDWDQIYEMNVGFDEQVYVVNLEVYDDYLPTYREWRADLDKRERARLAADSTLS